MIGHANKWFGSDLMNTQYSRVQLSKWSEYIGSVYWFEPNLVKKKPNRVHV